MLLRELYEAKARRVVAVMPGGFHPFHPGHKSLYDWAVKTFGQKNVYVAATNDTASRPFPFEVKKKLAAMAGVPENNFIQVKSPFNAMSYKDIVDADTALVFVRSQKDKNEQPLPDQTKKNGEPGYLRTYTGKALNTSDEMGYMAYGPTINFDFSGMQIKSASELRATWPEMSDEDKLKAAKLMYGNGAKAAVQLLDKALGGSVDEGDVIPFKKSNPANPHLDKDALDTWNKERNQKMAQDMIRLAPEIVEYYKELKDQNKDTETAIDIIAYDFDIDQYDVKRILQADNVDEDVSPENEKKFHNELDDLVHKYFGDSPDEVKMKKKYRKTDEILGFATKRPKTATIKKKKEKFDEPTIADKIAARRKAAARGDKDAWKTKKTLEKAPPGREKQVKALKKKFDDPGAPYAIAWAQHNKKKK